MKKICITIGVLLLSSGIFAEESPELTNPPQEDGSIPAEAEVALPKDAEAEGPAENEDPAEIEGPNGDDLLVEVAGSCSATADCWDGSTVSCSTSGGSGGCDWEDSNCPWEHGWVTCGWEEEHCPPCPCPPPASKCIEGRSCTEPCGSECGPGTCINGSCNCLI